MVAVFSIPAPRCAASTSFAKRLCPAPDPTPLSIRYADHSTAVGGVLQALMLTKSVLYVGFGLEDDNFHRMHGVCLW